MQQHTRAVFRVVGAVNHCLIYGQGHDTYYERYRFIIEWFRTYTFVLLRPLYISYATIIFCEIVRYCIDNCRNWGRISTRCWVNKSHPIHIFLRKIDSAITALSCISTTTTHPTPKNTKQVRYFDHDLTEVSSFHPGPLTYICFAV